MSTEKITDLPLANSIDASLDVLPIVTSNINTTQKISRNTLLNLTSQPLGLTDTQNLTNKTFDNTNTITIIDSNLTLQNANDTTRQANFDLINITPGATRSINIPDVSSTMVLTSATQTLIGKTLTSPTINSPTIYNATITADTYAGYSVSNTGTIYGVSISTGNVSMPGTLGVTGATTLSSTLAVTGATTVNSTVATTGQLSLQTGTSPPAAGLATSGIKVSSTANFGIFWGAGAPTFSAAQGSIYLNTTGSSTTTRAYVNTTGSTTWTYLTGGA